ncbi:MAG: zinc-ribbon domain-containing protein [Armatimonadetes bacterium]|nr:zinc-ribbon domain-containing protein [Armatimonadota bacterium]
MFFIFGWGRRTNKLRGTSANYTCSNCRNEVSFQLVETKKWYSLFFIPIIPYDSQNLMLCPICSSGYVLSDLDFVRELDWKNQGSLAPRTPVFEGQKPFAGSLPTPNRVPSIESRCKNCSALMAPKMTICPRCGCERTITQHELCEPAVLTSTNLGINDLEISDQIPSHSVEQEDMPQASLSDLIEFASRKGFELYSAEGTWSKETDELLRDWSRMMVSTYPSESAESLYDRVMDFRVDGNRLREVAYPSQKNIFLP